MKDAKNELIQFVAGVVMLAVGLFIFSQKVIVYSGFFHGFFMFGSGRISSGLIIVPLIIGIVWMFISGASFPSKVFTSLATLLIIVSVIMSTHLYLSAMSLYEWILILILIFGGAGLTARVLLAGGRQDDRRTSKRMTKDKNEKYGDTFLAGNSVDEELDRLKRNMK